MGEDLKILNDNEINEGLKTIPGWIYQDNKLTKEFKFRNFSTAVDFINRLAPFCNKIDHHPDIHIYYTKIVFELQRFSVGGKVTDLDFAVAGEIERLYSQMG